MTDDPLESARRLAVTYLSQFRAPTPEELQVAMNVAIAGVQALGVTVDREQLLRLLQSEVSVFQEDASVLTDPDEDHEPWLDRRRPDIDWSFWMAYRDWNMTRLPGDVVRGMDRFTDEILDLIGDPARQGSWDRRGMVVGQVQSGKTSNYTGLICKAADAGYRFIVVLAGLHNSLRSQTQGRLDEGFLGLDSRTTEAFANTNRAIGVGAGGRNHPPAMTLTSSEERGDFSRAVASRVAMRVGSDPVILVVKKNKTILTNLIDWVTSSNGQRDPETGRRVVRRFPLLVIDDEADNASVNTKEIEFELDTDSNEVLSETNPSEINRLIRLLLYSFDRSSLVSYTATPFANIFIDEEQRSPQWGEDLFPRSFILRMPPPSNYLGPAEVFGVAGDQADGDERPGLPVVRTVLDSEDWLRTGHRKTEIPGEPPASLKEALRAFVLVCAARAARGQTSVHNSMLVHVTRFVDVQALVYEQVVEEIEGITDALQYGGPGHAIRRELRELWEQDFVATSRRMPEALRGEPLTWPAVDAALGASAARVRVIQINGTAGDSLTYADHPDGVSVVAIGGDKLSRGLTLEGLSVSYYLRASKMYDTLMQMGRWFGYRGGYNDLVRLYTTGDLQLWYRDITVANDELNNKFDEMAAVRSNPRQFALFVRRSPAGLLVTARAKMRSGVSLDISFSGDIVETITFRRERELQGRNTDEVEGFLARQSQAGRDAARDRTGNRIWRDVPGSAVADLLEALHTSETATKANGRLLATYVRDRLSASELAEWTVALVSNSQAAQDKQIEFAGEQDVGMTLRNPLESVRDPDVYAIRRLVSPSDERLDLDETETERAQTLTRIAFERGLTRASKAPGQPIGPYVRRARPVGRGLLILYPLDPSPANLDTDRPLIGFAISFPESPGAPTISYVVPRRYWEREFA